MKRFVWLAVMALMLSYTVRAQSPTFEVTGVVMDYSNPIPVPVPNQAVHITIDSTANGFVYQHIVYTDTSGYYIDYIYIPPGIGMAIVTVATFDQCLGSYQVQTTFWAAGTQFPPINFELCNNFPPECQAMFDYWSDPSDPLTIMFLNSSVGNYSFVTWDFGDGGYSFEPSPVHTYAEAGEYYVTLSISDSLNGCGSTVTKPVIAGQTVIGCENYFYYSFVDSMTVEFTGYLIDSSYTALSYEWDFGDGAYGTGQTVTHTFSTNPNGMNLFFVCLTTVATENTGTTCTSVSCQEVFIGPGPAGCDNWFYYVQEDSLTFSFTGEHFWYDSTQVAQTVYFWDFGDGTTGYGQNVTHTFVENPVNGGTVYYVCLTTSSYSVSGNTCNAYSCQEVWINGQPFDCFNWFDYYQDDLTFTFSGYVFSNLPADYTWEFGDGVSATGQQVVHTFDQSGIYFVTLTTIDSSGCTWTSTTEVWVNIFPTFAIFGNVILSSGALADDATVRLMTTDSTWQNIFEVASVSTDQNGYFQFDSVPLYNYRMYYLQAELNAGSAWYGQYLPTYHISSLNWQEAQPVLPLNNWPYDIYMIEGTTTASGIGAISGSVTSMSRGIMEDVEVILLSEEMEPYMYVRSDASGEFSFEGLAWGNYMVYAEIMGVQTTPVMITLSEDQPVATVEVQVQGSEANYVVFGMTEKLKLLTSVGQPYPNPAGGNVSLEIRVSQPVLLHLTLYNQVGQAARSNVQGFGAGVHTVSVSLDGLPAGFYYLKATTPQGDYFSRRVIKSR